MSDIVERLKAYAKDQGGWHNIDDTCEEAAAEIERLRGLYEREHAYGHVQTQLLEVAEARLAEAVDVVRDCIALMDGNIGGSAQQTGVLAEARTFLAKLEGRKGE